MNRLEAAARRINAWLLAAGDAHLLVLTVADERARGTRRDPFHP